MKNFEESLRQLNAPDLPVEAFRQKLRHDLVAAEGRQSARRWRRACAGTGTLAIAFAIALVGFVTTPELPQAIHASLLGDSAPQGIAVASGDGTPGTALPALLAETEISVEDDRAFIETYYANRGDAVHVRSVDSERVVAVREFTMSDGRQMMVFTDVGQGATSSSTQTPLSQLSPMLASSTATTF